MSRRVRMDPETARVVEERLQWLLREHGPQAPIATESQRAASSTIRGRRAAPNESAADRAPTTLAESDPHDGLDELDGLDDIDQRQRRPPRDRPSRDQPSRDRSSREVGQAPDRADSGASATSRRDRPQGTGAVTALLTAATTFRRPHLVVVGVIVALGILLAGWAVLRARPVAVAVTPPPSTVSGASTGSDGASGPAQGSAAPNPTGASAAPTLVVHVLGAVKKPGLVTLTAGSRVQDAIDAAGGLTRKADPGELNLAQQVSDGQQIMVGTKAKPSGELRSGSSGGSGSSSGAGSTGGSAGSSGQPVNLNTASQAQLEELPGVGPVMAGKIIAWRTEHGRFSRVEELQEIDGVGPKTYAKLAPLCQV